MHTFVLSGSASPPQGNSLRHAAEVVGGAAATYLAVVAHRKHMRPHGFAVFCGFLICVLVSGACAVQSTFPSSAPKKQITGLLDRVVQHGSGRNSSYIFFIQRSGGSEMGFRAAVTAPFFAQGQLVTIVYLDEKSEQYPRAIAYQALTGPRAGDADSVSADWLGPWLGVPLWFIAAIAIRTLYPNRRVYPDSTALSVTPR